MLPAAEAPTTASHWSYQPVKRPAVPQVKNSSWPRNDIDQFVLARLEAAGLQPVPDAEPATLVRRAYFDLIGLPPTPEQIDAIAGEHPKGWTANLLERMVDELLASPHFGERWARHWLDVARYGESVTLRGFIYKEAWRYRDYVINAFNEDLPYNQFIQEQIAGDLLPAASVKQKQRQHVATTFLALGNSNFEEQDKKQLEMDVVDEQLDTIGKAFLAQTIGCARCHDHKFDPIPTRDYYAMAGILKNARLLEHANVSKWVERPLPLEPEEEQVFAEHESRVAGLEKKIKDAKEQLKSIAGASGEARDVKPTVIAANQLAGIIVDSSQAKAVGEWKHSQYSKHYIGDGYLHDLDGGKGQKTLTFMPELKQGGRYEVRFAYVHAPSRAAKVPVTVFHAEGETLVHVNQKEPPLIDNRFVSLGQFRFEANNFSYVIVSTEDTTGYVTADAVQFLPAEMAEPRTTNKEPHAPSTAETKLTDEVKALEKQLKQLRETGPKRPMIMSVKEEKDIEDLHVHIRGSVHRLGEKAPRGFLTVAYSAQPELPKNESGRRELAAWLASDSNPLTARVIVNRVWHWLFGAGLVRTTDNFGTTGETPSHPELLDYLATWFVDHGWSVKKLIREIMLSRTYQLASDSSGALQQDPENRLLWRMSPRRLEAECIRDAMLRISGQLLSGQGGPGYPAILPSDYGFAYKEPRRTIYAPVFRNALLPLLDAFDFADPSTTTGERNTSTVAPQALFLMNNSFVMEQAAATARRIEASSGNTTRERILYVYRLVLGRPPTEREIEIANAHLEAATSQLQAWAQLSQALFASVDFRYLQ